MYGHLDKQPEMTGWTESPGPWEPVLKNDRLSGRLAAPTMATPPIPRRSARYWRPKNAEYRPCPRRDRDRGVQENPVRRTCLSISIILSGKDRHPRSGGLPGFGCGNYDQLWLTASRVVIGNLTVQVLTEGVHSGDASGVVVTSSFRIARQLLSRVEAEAAGR